MNKNTAIKVQNLTKIYHLYDKPQDRLKEALNPFKKSYHKDFYALKDVSFEIKRGEVVGIIGKNGSGKSTLLKIITGVLTPTSGSVHVNGRISAILELGAGFNSELSGIENVYLSMSINGYTKEETDKKVKEIVDFSELDEFIYQPTKTYSSGMKARLGFAVAINIEPDILIVDEALSVGDAAFQRKCFAKMETIRQSGATILFVSHSDASIVSLCSRAIWVSGGKFIIEGEPKLVTGLYMKNSSKKQINKQEIQKELTELETNSKEADTEEKKKEQNTKPKPQIEEYYDPSLKSKSTIYYEEKGAKIGDVKITTLDGEEVNVLKTSGEYIFTYIVTFINKTNLKIIFGYSVSNMLGIALAGGNYPEKQKYIGISSKIIKIKWKFKCNLLDNDYFFTCGVMSEKGQYLARYKDAYMVRVKSNDRNQSIGIVDMNTIGMEIVC